LRHEKKAPAIPAVHYEVLSHAQPDLFDVVIEKVDEAEMEEMWSFVQHKGQHRWLWHAIDHTSGAV
jgi:insertion element IS1 protein InsB